MNATYVKKYFPENPILKNLVKYYWMIRSSQATAIDSKLFPSNNIDFIINFSAPISYTNHSHTESFERPHFRGIGNSCLMLQQSGVLDVLGISFFPMGVYPIVKMPLFEFSGKTLFLEEILKGIDSEFDELRTCKTDGCRIIRLEKILLKRVDLALFPREAYHHFVSNAYELDANIGVENYCRQVGIHQKTFGRFFKKMTGINPKSFVRLTRFQMAVNRLICGTYENLSSLTYEMGYFDQTHFIKDFKAHMSSTPMAFVKHKNSVKELLSEH